MENKKSFLQDWRDDKRLIATIVCILLAAAIVITAMFLFSDRAKQYVYEQTLSQGYSHMDDKQFGKAIETFELAYRLNPTDAAAMALAEAWAANENTEKAIQILTARIALYGGSEPMENRLVELKESIGIFAKIPIGGKEFEHDSTAIILENVPLTEADTQAISQFKGLVTLSLINCELSSIDFLADCNELLSVTLSGNPITDFTPLHNKPNLRTLYINDTPITDYSQLHPLTTLTTLNINGDWIRMEDLQALYAALPTCMVYSVPSFVIQSITIGDETFDSDISEVDLSGRNISDLTPLKSFTALHHLNLSNNRITYITALEGLTELNSLNLSGNPLSNIGSVQNMSQMNTLNLADCKVTDISPIGTMTALTELHIDNNPIYYGHGVLSGLTSLQILSAQNALLKDEHLPLLPMGSLTELDIRNNPRLSQAAVTALAEQYPNCKILHDYAPAEPEPTAADAEETAPEAEVVPSAENDTTAEPAPDTEDTIVEETVPAE